MAWFIRKLIGSASRILGFNFEILFMTNFIEHFKFVFTITEALNIKLSN